MSAPAQRLLSVLLLALWMAPGLGALGVGLHLILDHHHDHQAEHASDLSDLAQAAAHGHRHDATTTPDHEHEARFDGTVPAERLKAATVAALPAQAVLPAVAPAEPPNRDGFPRRAPPPPLFTAHCSLLL